MSDVPTPAAAMLKRALQKDWDEVAERVREGISHLPAEELATIAAREIGAKLRLAEKLTRWG